MSLDPGFENVSSYLGQVANASRSAGKAVWANTELFEVYPPSCQWPSACRGRHPAPFSRIVKQLANEARFVDKLIAWEWMSCLSAQAGRLLYKGMYPEANALLYAQYLAYVRGPSALVATSGTAVAPPSAAELLNIKARFTAQVTSRSTAGVAATYASTLLPNGTWADI